MVFFEDFDVVFFEDFDVFGQFLVDLVSDPRSRLIRVGLFLVAEVVASEQFALAVGQQCTCS